MVREQIKPLFDRLVEQERPDVILIGREALAYHLVDLCRERRLPSILIAHGVPTAALLDGIYPEQATQELVDCLRKVTVIVTVANHLAEVLKTLGLQRVQTIPNVIDPRRFCPQPKSRRLLEDLRLRAYRFRRSSHSTSWPHSGSLGDARARGGAVGVHDACACVSI